MKISLIDNQNLGRIVSQQQVSGLNDLATYIPRSNYSLSLFDGDKRAGRNFTSSWFLGLDIDGGLSIATAKSVVNLLGIKAIVAPTRNHQIMKNGKSADRYRLIFDLGREVVDKSEYIKLLKLLILFFPEADEACIDVARLFFPSTSGEIVGGDKSVLDHIKKIPGHPPRISKDGLRFLKGGAEQGEWHKSMNTLIGCLISSSIDQELASLICASIAIRHGNQIGLDEEDIAQIEDLYSRYRERNLSVDKDRNQPSNLIPSNDKAREQIKVQRERRKKAVSQSLPLLDPIFEKMNLQFPPGLILLGNESGKGKTTTVLNIVSEIQRRKPKARGFVIAAEVTSEDYYSGVAANLEDLDFLKYRAGKLDSQSNDKIEKRTDEIPSWLRVIGHSECPEIQNPDVVIELMGTAVSKGYSYIILDYYQRISSSKQDPIPTIKRFGDMLNRFCSEHLVPVIVMVQLRPDNLDYPAEFSERIQQDRHVFNHASLVIEMVTESDANRVQFIVRKSRFAIFENKNIWLAYKDGRLIFDEAACYATL
jgi:hypothetical protein